MTPQYSLKEVHKGAIPRAIERAKHYRLLNDPEQAESICLDILQADPDNVPTLIILILAITDQFSTGGSATARRARKYAEQLKDDYQCAYYHGIIAEREGRAFLGRGPARSFAFEFFEEAMFFYEKADELHPESNEDAILRWNSCARTIMRHNLKPRPVEPEQMLE
jgi:tetratricopeptide (TPR) repeat protein